MSELSQDEKYIYDECPELSVGEQIGWTDRIFNLFPALKNPNYQLYFSGQLISLIGTWLQIIAQDWLVLKLTNSAFLIGLFAAVATLPTLLFTLFGGVIVDRFKKRKVLIFTQTSSIIMAFILGLLTITNHISFQAVTFLAFLLGVVTAVDSPARQVFVVEMVGKRGFAICYLSELRNL